jgi:hypothetical protein
MKLSKENKKAISTTAGAVIVIVVIVIIAAAAYSPGQHTIEALTAWGLPDAEALVACGAALQAAQPTQP